MSSESESPGQKERVQAVEGQTVQGQIVAANAKNRVVSSHFNSFKVKKKVSQVLAHLRWKDICFPRNVQRPFHLTEDTLTSTKYI